MKDGPSAKAGVRPGDVILSVNERLVETSSELPAVVARIKPGNDAKLTVWRGGKEEKISVKVDALDEPETQTAALKGGKGKKPNTDLASELGLAVRPLDPRGKAAG